MAECILCRGQAALGVVEHNLNNLCSQVHDIPEDFADFLSKMRFKRPDIVCAQFEGHTELTSEWEMQCNNSIYTYFIRLTSLFL